MAAGSYETLFKLLVIGDTGVGKTCIILRYVDNHFSKNMLSTIGVDFKTKTIRLRQRQIKLQIWDTAGHERFRTITNAFYRGAMGIVLAYDVTNEKSFNNIAQWMKNISDQCTGSDDPVRVIVGNKCDLAGVVERERAEELATRYRCRFFETSAQSGRNIDEAFTYLTEAILDREAMTLEKKRMAEALPPKPATAQGLRLHDRRKKQSSSCSCKK